MTKLLSLDEMLDCAREMGLPEAALWAGQLESIGSTMAAGIADKLGVVSSDATAEGVAFAGTCARFSPAYEGQPCPEALEPFDPDADWGPEAASNVAEKRDA